MKASIAVTCLVVIAAIGFWTWKVLGDQEAERVAGETRAFRSFCASMLSDLEDPAGDYTLWHVQRCLDAGNFTEADLNQRRLGYVVTELKKL